MILNWFSPLPPAKTGIAAYTARLLPALCRRAQIILWTDQAEWDPTLENYAEVRRYQPEHIAWAELNRGDMSVYHIGNNHLFHSLIWQVSRYQPGIVVLHDICLQNFFTGLYRDQWHDRDGYVAQMEKYYGQRGHQDATTFWTGGLSIEYMAEPYPLTPLAVDNALGVLVHSAYGWEDLKRQNPCPVLYAPLPYSASHRSPAMQPAARIRAGGPPYRLVVFGYIGSNRQLDALLQAIAGLPERAQFCLDIYGQLWDDGHVRRQLQALGLQELVTWHGYVSEAELDAVLWTSHLGINLRYPTMGEASLSQLQMWDHALPTLVTRVGWYANCPEDAVAFVRPEHEVMDIQAHLRAFLANPDRFATMGECGRRILEEQHAPEVYAQAIVHLAAEAQRLRPHAAAYELAKRVSGEMQVWTSHTVPYLVSHLYTQGEEYRLQKSVPEKQFEGLAPQQAAALQGMREAMAEHGERLRHAQQLTLEAIRRAVAAHTERLRHLQNVTLQNAPKEPSNREHALLSL